MYLGAYLGVIQTHSQTADLDTLTKSRSRHTTHSQTADPDTLTNRALHGACRGHHRCAGNYVLHVSTSSSAAGQEDKPQVRPACPPSLWLFFLVWLNCILFACVRSHDTHGRETPLHWAQDPQAWPLQLSPTTLNSTVCKLVHPCTPALQPISRRPPCQHQLLVLAIFWP